MFPKVLYYSLVQTPHRFYFKIDISVRNLKLEPMRTGAYILYVERMPLFLYWSNFYFLFL